jgi:hypothetical protein
MHLHAYLGHLWHRWGQLAFDHGVKAPRGGGVDGMVISAKLFDITLADASIFSLDLEQVHTAPRELNFGIQIARGFMPFNWCLHQSSHSKRDSGQSNKMTVYDT